jgi:S1-C subfamily serine protease
MDLTETFKAIAPSIVGFAETLVQSPDGSVPHAPRIFATGFIVDPAGIVATNRHVVEYFQHVVKHPVTGKAAMAAVYFHLGLNPEGKLITRMIPIPIVASTYVQSITAEGVWHGDNEPDIGFVQLGLRDMPALKLAFHAGAIETGMPIATAGYPMGSAPLTIMNKLNQMMPFLRRGIVSSVYPFPIEHPQGFTIDILQQGGSSGSPIFYVDKPEVVGMMASSMIDAEENTNISLCIPSAQITDALRQLKESYPPKLENIPTLTEHLETIPMKTSSKWERFGPEGGLTPSQ